jgi:hypothetical protein
MACRRCSITRGEIKCCGRIVAAHKIAGPGQWDNNHAVRSDGYLGLSTFTLTRAESARILSRRIGKMDRDVTTKEVISENTLQMLDGLESGV